MTASKARQKIDAIEGYLLLEQSKQRIQNQMDFLERDDKRYIALDKQLDKLDRDLDLQYQQGTRIFNGEDFIYWINQFTENKSATKLKLLNNSSLANCKKLIAESENQDYKPTISHYRDKENGMTDKDLLTNYWFNVYKDREERNRVKAQKDLKSKKPSIATFAKLTLARPKTDDELMKEAINQTLFTLKQPKTTVDNILEIARKQNGIKTVIAKRANPLTDDKAIMLVKKLDRTASGALNISRLSADEKAAIKSHSSYFYVTSDVTGDKLRLTEKAYKWLEGTENGKLKAKQNCKLPVKRVTKTKPNFTDFEFDFDKGKRDLSKMFQGKVNGEKRSTLASDIQPNKTMRMGRLSKVLINGLKGEKIELNFDGDSWLSMDRRKNLWLSGKDSRLNLRANGIKLGNDQMKCLGHMTQINYITDKKHIENGQMVEYYHKLGEVNKELPSLWVDADGFLVVNGGDYDIWKEGIVN